MITKVDFLILLAPLHVTKGKEYSRKKRIFQVPVCLIAGTECPNKK